MVFKKQLLLLCYCLFFIENCVSLPFGVENLSSSGNLYISYEPTSSDKNCRLASECAGLSEIIVDIDRRKEFQVCKSITQIESNQILDFKLLLTIFKSKQFWLAKLNSVWFAGL